MTAVLCVIGVLFCGAICLGSIGSLIHVVLDICRTEPTVVDLYNETIAQGKPLAFFVVMGLALFGILLRLLFIALSGWGTWVLIGMV